MIFYAIGGGLIVLPAKTLVTPVPVPQVFRSGEAAISSAVLESSINLERRSL
jgi:hypothetical protein